MSLVFWKSPLLTKSVAVSKEIANNVDFKKGAFSTSTGVTEFCCFNYLSSFPLIKLKPEKSKTCFNAMLHAKLTFWLKSAWQN